MPERLLGIGDPQVSPRQKQILRDFGAQGNLQLGLHRTVVTIIRTGTLCRTMRHAVQVRGVMQGQQKVGLVGTDNEGFSLVGRAQLPGFRHD